MAVTLTCLVCSDVISEETQNFKQDQISKLKSFMSSMEKLKLVNVNEIERVEEHDWESLATSRDSLCCSTCDNILRNVKNTYELLIQTEKKLGAYLNQVQTVVKESIKKKYCVKASSRRASHKLSRILRGLHQSNLIENPKTVDIGKPERISTNYDNNETHLNRDELLANSNQNDDNTTQGPPTRLLRKRKLKRSENGEQSEGPLISENLRTWEDVNAADTPETSSTIYDDNDANLNKEPKDKPNDDTHLSTSVASTRVLRKRKSNRIVSAISEQVEPLQESVNIDNQETTEDIEEVELARSSPAYNDDDDRGYCRPEDSSNPNPEMSTPVLTTLLLRKRKLKRIVTVIAEQDERLPESSIAESHRTTEDVEVLELSKSPTTSNDDDDDHLNPSNGDVSIPASPFRLQSATSENHVATGDIEVIEVPDSISSCTNDDHLSDCEPDNSSSHAAEVSTSSAPVRLARKKKFKRIVIVIAEQDQQLPQASKQQKDAQRKEVIQHEKPFKCIHDGCLYASRTWRDLQVHQNTHLPKEQRPDLISCPHCGRKLFKKVFSYHMKVSHKDILDSLANTESQPDPPNVSPGEESLLCDTCGKTFLTKKNLGDHKRRVHEECPPICQCCGKQCKNWATYKSHMRCRHPDQPILNRMSRFRKPFVATARYKSALEQRRKVKQLMPMRKWPCDQCDIVCGSKYTLDRHVRSIHLGTYVRPEYKGGRRKRPTTSVKNDLFLSEILCD